MKIENFEQIHIQFVTIAYVDEGNIRSKFGENPLMGAIGWNKLSYHIYWFIFFSEQIREQIHGRILTRNGSNNAKSRKNVPFWGYKVKNWNLTPIYPEILKQVGPK